MLVFVLRQLQEETATGLCPPSAETLKNGITSHTMLVGLFFSFPIYACINTYRLIPSKFVQFLKSGQGHARKANYAQHANLTFS